MERLLEALVSGGTHLLRHATAAEEKEKEKEGTKEEKEVCHMCSLHRT